MPPKRTFKTEQSGRSCFGMVLQESGFSLHFRSSCGSKQKADNDDQIPELLGRD